MLFVICSLIRSNYDQGDFKCFRGDLERGWGDSECLRGDGEHLCGEFECFRGDLERRREDIWGLRGEFKCRQGDLERSLEDFDCLNGDRARRIGPCTPAWRLRPSHQKWRKKARDVPRFEGGGVRYC